MSVARRDSKVVRLRAATAGALVAAALVSGCGGSSGLSSQDKKDFVAGCTSGGGKMAFCQCYLDELVKRGLDTQSEIKTASENTQKGQTDPKLKAAVLACKSKF
jgi:hypothetical protein